MWFCKNCLLVTLLVIVSCKAQKTSRITNDGLDNLIAKRLGTVVSKTNNFDGSYVLAWSEDNQSGTPIIKYGVWVIETGELIFANTAIRGNVKWLDNTSLLVEDYPGIVEGDRQNYKFKIDLKTKVKIPLYEKENI